jgi:hypothetical protein
MIRYLRLNYTFPYYCLIFSCEAICFNCSPASEVLTPAGTKEFTENYQKPSENSLLPLYYNIIRNLIEDDLKSKYLPIIY